MLTPISAHVLKTLKQKSLRDTKQLDVILDFIGERDSWLSLFSMNFSVVFASNFSTLDLGSEFLRSAWLQLKMVYGKLEKDVQTCDRVLQSMAAILLAEPLDQERNIDLLEGLLTDV